MLSEKQSSVYMEYINNSHSDKFFLSVNKKDKPEFEDYCEARVSNKTLRLITFFLALCNAYFYCMALINAKSRILILIVAGSLYLIRNPFVLFVIYLKSLVRKGIRGKFIDRMMTIIPYITNFLPVHSVLGLGVYLIARVLNGRCESLDQLHVWGCNSEYDSHALPQEIMFCLMFLPILFSTIFKAVKFKYIMISWFFSVSCIVISIGLGGALQSIPTLVIYVPVSLIVLLENHRENIIRYQIFKKQQILLQANKQLSEEAQNELRFMIANMAHDLKTPLSAFMNGVETLSSAFADLRRSPTPHGSQPNRDYHRSIKDNIKNLFNVNQFMTMTINRCIDYMKASKGIKLEPRLETINLQEVLSMPLNCMRDLQSRIAIIQKPIPSNVCSHIITDLQWFQENLFCLISNAVKYSSHGHVAVSVCVTSGTHSSIASAKEVQKKRSLQMSPEVPETPVRSPPPEPVLHERYSFLDRLDPTSTSAMAAAASAAAAAIAAAGTGAAAAAMSPTAAAGAVASAAAAAVHSRTASPRRRTASGDNVDEPTVHLNEATLDRVEQGNVIRQKPQPVQLPSPNAKNAKPQKQQQPSSGKSLFGSFSFSRKNKVYAAPTADSLGPSSVVQPSTESLRVALPGSPPEHVDDFLLVEVEDTGIGLTDELKSRLFAPFKQAQRRAGGTGLGLYSLAKRVDALGGYYGVSNRRDGEQGSIFWFAVPYRPDEQASLVSETRTQMGMTLAQHTSDEETEEEDADMKIHIPPMVSSSSTLPVTLVGSRSGIAEMPPTPVAPKLRILLVDDSLTILKMTSNLLKRHGHVVDQEENGADALTRLEKTRNNGGPSTPPYDVMLIDLNMPVMDGLEATKRLRELENQLNATSPVPFHQRVFAFSANSDRETMAEAMDAGADDFICKPFSIQTFNEKIEKFRSNNTNNTPNDSTHNSNNNMGSSMTLLDV